MRDNKHYEVIVTGAGHAGCEAAIAAARTGCKTLLVSMNLSAIGLMPCNPSIGGPGKGHLIRELSVFDTLMPACADECLIQLKWLNTSRGAAVRSRRAQIDKKRYAQAITRKLFSTDNLQIREGQVTEIIVSQNQIKGIKLETGLIFYCDKLVITSGTYLNSKVITGHNVSDSGPHGQRAASILSGSLQKNGILLTRLQTATPMRILDNSIDPQKLKLLPGDENAGGFLWENRNRKIPNQKPCYLAMTTEQTIAAVKRNLQFSPLKLENITNIGPGHCPSIDRKIMRFPDQINHQIFVEPEGSKSRELYLQGLTTGMPPESQRDILNNIPGLENAIITRYGYAIEYDALKPGQLKKTMESRVIKNLYTAGQINGTSGYEEAAAQGLIAGLNASLSLKGQKPFLPSRTTSYLGVLADDLATWDKPDPYRITPGHAEFRLNLRDDSAEKRLIEQAFECNMIDQQRYDMIKQWLTQIQKEVARFDNTMLYPDTQTRNKLSKHKVGDLKKRITASDFLQRPQINYINIFDFINISAALTETSQAFCLETEIKYRGYFEREYDRIVQTEFLEKQTLPLKVDKKLLKGLSEEGARLVQSNSYDDLNQLSRKNCLSRGELAILLSILNK